MKKIASKLDVSNKNLGEIFSAAKELTKVRRKEKDICTLSGAKREIVKILKTTGDKKAEKAEIDSFLEVLFDSCKVGAATGAVVAGETAERGEEITKKEPKKISGWVCYLKICAKKEDMSYMECMKDKKRKEKEYYPKKDYWQEEAQKGCPTAKK